MRSFQNVFSKICIFGGIAPAIWVFFRALKSEYSLGFSKKVSDEHTYHFYIKSAPLPGISAFTPSKSLRRFRKDNNYLEKFFIHTKLF